jgi:hypothetical protein
VALRVEGSVIPAERLRSKSSQWDSLNCAGNGRAGCFSFSFVAQRNEVAVPGGPILSTSIWPELRIPNRQRGRRCLA